MEITQALELMKLDKLPASSNNPSAKCIALVERVSGIKDYAIVNKVGIVCDKGSKSAIRKVIEYYPAKKKQEDVVAEEVVVPEIVVEEPVVEVPVVPEPPKEEKAAEDEANVAVEEPVLSERQKMIEYLVSKKMNKGKLDAKSDEELVKIMKIYNQKEKGV